MHIAREAPILQPNAGNFAGEEEVGRTRYASECVKLLGIRWPDGCSQNAMPGSSSQNQQRTSRKSQIEE